MMDDRDYYWLSACILVLCGCTCILARRVRVHDDDIRFLMDNAVTRDTIRKAEA